MENGRVDEEVDIFDIGLSDIALSICEILLRNLPFDPRSEGEQGRWVSVYDNKEPINFC